MSYDISLQGDEPVDLGSYTANLRYMWHEALGHDLRELDGQTGAEALESIRRAVDDMIARPVTYSAMNPPNSWGDSRDALILLLLLEREIVKAPGVRISVTT